jgi:Chaperone of endosialidase
MNPLIQLKTTALLLITSALLGFALSPTAQAVVPAPDGGYPGFTTAEGNSALQNLTTGVGNTATGWHSLFANTTGNLNTAIGAGTLLLNTGDNNTATGALSLLSNTTGFYNTADGAFALFSNTTGSGNTGSGYQALFSNQTGANNAAFGYTSLYNNTESFNTAFGSQTLVFNTTGGGNTASGYQALVFNTTGAGNTASGQLALRANTQGFFNTAFGIQALVSNTTGSSNIALGEAAGANLTTGNSNIYIGNRGVNAESNTIRIGSSSSNLSTYIAGIAGQAVGAGGSTCYVDNEGKLGVFLSARRFKTDIADMGDVSETLLALRPVTFHYKPELDKTGIPQFGLIAEEVAKVNPALVTHDANGDISTVRYEAVSIMLLNEFLKDHNKVGEQQSRIDKQEATIAQQQKQIEALTEGLQKVSAQLAAASPSRGGLEASEPAPQVVNNP